LFFGREGEFIVVVVVVVVVVFILADA